MRIGLLLTSLALLTLTLDSSPVQAYRDYLTAEQKAQLERSEPCWSRRLPQQTRALLMPVRSPMLPPVDWVKWVTPWCEMPANHTMRPLR